MTSTIFNSFLEFELNSLIYPTYTGTKKQAIYLKKQAIYKAHH